MTANFQEFARKSAHVVGGGEQCNQVVDIPHPSLSMPGWRAGGGDGQCLPPSARRVGIGDVVRVLVTGAAGFIGSNLVDRLLRDGHQVVGVDNFRSGTRDNLEDALAVGMKDRRFTLVTADIQAPELVDIVVGTAPHAIFHLAAHVDTGEALSDPHFDARSNVLGTINLCEASRTAGVRRIVYAASGTSRYGASSSTVDENDRVDPLSPNAVAKLAGEMYLRAYAEQYGLTPICLALANVYGPRQVSRGTAGEISVLCSALITGSPYATYRSHTAAHDYLYVDDAVEAFLQAAYAPVETTGTFNIGTGRRATLSDVYRHITAALDGTPQPTPLDDTELDSLALNSAKAAEIFGWRPRVELSEGIRRTVSWLCEMLEPGSPALATA